MTLANEWVFVCELNALPPETAMRFDYRDRTYVIIRSHEGNYFGMDGHCSHEKIHLAGGIVDGHIIECPKHFGTFDYRTGEARSLPACIDLRSYEIRAESGGVFIKV